MQTRYLVHLLYLMALICGASALPDARAEDAAASRHTRLSLADNLAEVFAQAKEAGLSGEDWAVGQYRMAQRRGQIDR